MDSKAQLKLVTGVIALAALIASCTVLKGDAATAVGSTASAALLGLLAHTHIKNKQAKADAAKAAGGDQQ
jgi:hypothetical protein